MKGALLPSFHILVSPHVEYEPDLTPPLSFPSAFVWIPALQRHESGAAGGL